MELKDMSNDILGSIMSRLEATALASIACSSSHFRELARDEAHWRRLCNSTWPSTQLEEARRLISSSVSGGFAEFYGSTYPLIVYNHKAITTETVDVHTSPCDLVSLVDAFVNDKCVLSRVLDGVPSNILDQKFKVREIEEKGSERWRWFLSSPFEWDSLDQDQANGDAVDANLENPPSEYGLKELAETLRLSWILLDKKSGRAVNLSSWKPLLVRRNTPYDDSYTAQFGCMVPVHQSVLPHKSANCLITARFKMVADCLEGSLHWKELSLVIEDLEKARVNGEKSLKILNQALSTTRSINQLKVEDGWSEYEQEKSRIFKRKEFAEKLVGGCFQLIEVAAFVTCFYTLRNLF